MELAFSGLLMLMSTPQADTGRKERGVGQQLGWGADTQHIVVRTAVVCNFSALTDNQPFVLFIKMYRTL